MEATQQETTMHAQPQKEHQWLQNLIGEWTYETEASMGAAQPPAKTTGTEQVRALGDLWILAEGQGEMPGCGEAHTLMTIGYDPQKQCYVGTWIGSMMTSLWLYEEGQLDAAGQTLTLNSEGPSMTGEGTAKYRDVIEVKSNEHRTMTSYVLNNDGQWHQFMTVNYRKV